jgi:hypothetical protein
MSEACGGFPASTQAGEEVLRVQHVIGETLIRHTGFIGQPGRFLTASFGGNALLFRDQFRSRFRLDRENLTQPQGSPATR